MDEKDNDLIKKLRAPFDLADHEVRVLRDNGNTATWSVYIRREAITERLDSLFGLEWEFIIDRISDQMPNCVTVTGSILINGKRRTNNGGASPNVDNNRKPVLDENTEKAAVTDCFKRCASAWGIGLYLQNTPDIRTASTKKDDGKTDYQKLPGLETEAMQKFSNFLKTLLPNNIVPIEQGKQPPSIPAEGKIIETPLTGGKSSAAARANGKAAPVGGETAPVDAAAKIKSDKRVQAVWRTPKEADDTINKMWKEKAIHADMSDEEMIAAVEARLKRHRQPKTIGTPPDDEPEQEGA